MAIEGIDRVFRRVSKISSNMTRTIERPMKAAGTYMLGSIERNFKAGGRPAKWKPLAASTVRRRRRGGGSGGVKVLVDTAALKNSMSMRVRRTETEVGTNMVQAKRQHFGYDPQGKKGRGHSETPKRPYMLFQNEDTDAIGRIFLRHVRS